MSSTFLDQPQTWQPTGIIDSQMPVEPVLRTGFGALFEGDCVNLLPFVSGETIDTVFADPPFNLSKEYGMKVDDARPEEEYVRWCKKWLDDCIRVLKPGGALFVYNLPKWNVLIGSHLSERGLDFRHWIAVNIKLSLAGA